MTWEWMCAADPCMPSLAHAHASSCASLACMKQMVTREYSYHMHLCGNVYHLEYICHWMGSMARSLPCK